MLGHAIDAAEVATVGDGDAQIVDVPAEWIDHGSCGFHHLTHFHPPGLGAFLGPWCNPARTNPSLGPRMPGSKRPPQPSDLHWSRTRFASVLRPRAPPVGECWPGSRSDKISITAEARLESAGPQGAGSRLADRRRGGAACRQPALLVLARSRRSAGAVRQSRQILRQCHGTSDSFAVRRRVGLHARDALNRSNNNATTERQKSWQMS